MVSNLETIQVDGRMCVGYMQVLIVRAGREHLGILCPWLPGAHPLQMPGDDCIILLSENCTRFPLRRLLQLLCIMNVFSVEGPVVIFH